MPTYCLRKNFSKDDIISQSKRYRALFTHFFNFKFNLFNQSSIVFRALQEEIHKTINTLNNTNFNLLIIVNINYLRLPEVVIKRRRNRQNNARVDDIPFVPALAGRSDLFGRRGAEHETLNFGGIGAFVQRLTTITTRQQNNIIQPQKNNQFMS